MFRKKLYQSHEYFTQTLFATNPKSAPSPPCHKKNILGQPPSPLVTKNIFLANPPPPLPSLAHDIICELPLICIYWIHKSFMTTMSDERYEK